MSEKLTAVAINATLNASPTASSTQLLTGQVLDKLAEHGVLTSTVRAVDHDILPGISTDLGEGDEWPAIRQRILDADILVFGTPTWLGQHSSVAQRVLERLNADMSETDAQGKPVMFDKVALSVVVGNEDGAHHIVAVLSQALGDIGFTIPAQGSVYWNGEAMHKTDYQDLDHTPEKVEQSLTTAASNAVHLAKQLTQQPYPAA